MIFVTSDTHWSHKLMVAKRGYDSAYAMDEHLISLWNAAVQSSDFVYHLGDVSFASPQVTKRIAQALRGQVRLVPGNHDGKHLKILRDAGWEVLPPIHDLDINGRRVVLCHFPLATWRGCHRGALHLHGHCHGSLNRGDERTTRTDVGVDGIWGPGPVSLDVVLGTLGRRRYRTVDHHGMR